jgi:branched-chain amino acid transport system substrate-binding protein
MKRGIWLGLVVVVVVVAIIAVNRSKSDSKNICIGVILPLTGDGAKYGEETKRGIEIAWGLGTKDNPKLRYEDDQGLSTVAVAAFQRLITGGDVPLVIGPMYSSTALAVAPIAERKKVVMFSPSASTPDLTGAGDYIFRNWPSDVFEGGAMAAFVYDRLKQDKIAVLGQSLDYAMGIAKEFKRSYNVLGGTIIAEEYYAPGTTDFRTTLTKLKSGGVKCLYLPGMYAEIAIILRQQGELGIRPLNVSCVGFDNVEVLKLAGDSAEGVIFARPAFDAKSTNDVVRTFVETFKTRFGTEPGVYAAHAYDAANIVLSAVKRGGETADGIKQALYQTKDFDGVTGRTTIDSYGDVVKPIQFMIVKDHAFTTYEK